MEASEQKIFDVATDFAVVIIAEDGTIKDWSRGAEKIYGRSAGDAVGADLSGFLAEADQKKNALAQAIKSVKENGRAELYGFRTKANGEFFYGESVITALAASNGSAGDFVEILRDCTEKHEQEKSERLKAALPAAIIESLKDYVVFTSSAAGVIESWSPGAQKILGYKAEEVIGKDWRVFLLAEDLEAGKMEEELKQLRLKGRLETVGWRCKKGGGRIYVSGSSSNLRLESGQHITTIWQDHTKKHELEMELQARDSFMRAMLDAITNFAIYSISPEGMIETWNEGASNLFGCNASKVVGTDFRQFYTEAEVEAGAPERDMASAEKTGISESTGWRLRIDKSELLANSVMTPVRDEHGSARGFVIVVRDETERAKFQEELKQRDSFMTAMLDAITDFALYSVDKNGQIENWNIGAQRSFLYDANTAKGMDFRKFYEENDLASGVVEDSIETATTEGRSQLSGWRLRADGTRFYANDVMTPVLGESGVRGFVKVVSDITELHLQAEKEATRKAKVEELVSYLADVSTNISQVTAQLTRVAVNGENTVNTTMSTVADVRKTAEASSEQAKRVSADTYRVLNVSSQGLKSTENTVAGMMQIKEQVTAIAKCMVKLSAQSNTISEIIATVDDIAQQSTLLALNAQIEAAKAGEAGKGFEVVARHVKDLATQSKTATAHVRSVLSDVVKATVEAKKATDYGGEVAEAGYSQASDAGSAIATLAKSIEGAAEASREIEVSSQQQLTGMMHVEDAIASVKQSSDDTKSCSQTLSNSTERLLEIGNSLLEVLKTQQPDQN
jgi:PAS domain S-box-containing protein